MYNHYSNFGCSFVMVWDWAGHIVGRTFSLGSDRSHCDKNTRFGTEPVILWEEDRLRVFEKEAGEDIRG